MIKLIQGFSGNKTHPLLSFCYCSASKIT